ncbi:hypothetical protein FOA43_003415 [Brettanomyces nanus]|uniref:NADH dehydrogenase [ubiquinone] iron-sulfur protein 4, mitochondrial n=1 Tax=Eeniella nana TaxID=13502 RepID=A0A875S8M6_EENNA|nr:uncharacterized protein FOA43_003415 [Brettanomyces nanus]QPG76029.1 hypothetical protein FOA43_003415 [Brettanomyces nanus]
MFLRALRPSMQKAAAKNFEVTLRSNSSASTPVKIREIVDATTTSKEIVSGAPSELAASDNRVVRIYKEAQYATQSSARNSFFWKLEFDILPKGNRWENDLIGYQGTTDYVQATRLDFITKEDAVRFAEGQGWDYYVQHPKEKKFKVKQYANNFVHCKGPLKIIRTK